MAHELNNPLNNIGLFVGNLLDESEQAGSDARREALIRGLRAVLEQVKRPTQIITHLRTFGRVAGPTREAVDPNEVITTAVGLLSQQLRLRDIEVILDLGPIPLAHANQIQLEQVFINLLTNARDALQHSDKKRITIRSRLGREHLEIWIHDTGLGIPIDVLPRVFDPFFTTKEVGKGTGLGLSIAYGIVKEHQGSLSVLRHPGEGTEFLIALPLGAEASVLDEQSERGNPLNDPSETSARGVGHREVA